MRLREAFVLTLLAALAAAPLAALAEGPPAPLSLDEAVEIIEEIGGPVRYPNANSILAFDHTYVSFDESGAYREYGHTLTKILTEEGVDDHGDESIIYHRRYSSIDVQLARVIKSDGTEIVVGEDLITDGTPPQISAMNIFEADFRERTIVFPGLEIGDAIELLIVSEYEPLIDNGFNGIYFLQYTSPILESVLTIEGPEDMPLKHVVKDGDPEFTETTSGGRRSYTWRSADVVQIEREPAMPSPAQFAARVVVSTMHTWPEMSRYLFNLTDEKCVAEDSVKDLVLELTDGLEAQEDKIRAIHYWITENVRYLGVSMDRGAFLEPHFAAYTLEKEYGICRDKAVLMVTMLEEIGVPAWVVAINPSRMTDTEVPTVFWEHGIVAIEGADGDYRYIDPTLETSREVTANYAGDRWVIVLTEEGADLREVAHTPASANAGEIADVTELVGDGSISGSVTITGRGMYEEILRTIAKSAKEEQLRMMWEEAVQDIYPGAAMTSFDITDYEDLHQPLKISLAYEIDDYALDADPYVLFRVPASTGAFDFLSEIMVGRLTGLEEREHPVALGTTLGLTEESVVSLPDGFVVENLPDNVSFSEGVISLTIDYEFVPADENGGDAIIRYRREFGIDHFQISPEDYLSLKEAMRLAGRSTRGEVILKREEG